MPRAFTAFIKRYKWILTAVCLAALALSAGGLLLARGGLDGLGGLPFLSGGRAVDFRAYYAMDPDEMGIVLDGARVAEAYTPFVEDGVVYLPEDFIRAYIDPFLFWDYKANAAIVTTRSDMLRFYRGNTSYDFQDETRTLAHPVREQLAVLYLPDSLVMGLYPHTVEYKSEQNLLVISSGPAPMGELTRKTDIRYLPDGKSAIAVKAQKGDEVYLYAAEGDYTRVRTADGLVGYAPTADIAPLDKAEAPPRRYITGQPIVNTEAAAPLWPAGVSINMMWEDVHNPDAVALKMESPLPLGVNVIAPSFFRLGEDALLESIASHDYVAWAHGQGARVWGMMAGLTSDLNHAAFAYPDKRRELVAQLAAYTREYALDGLNIDVEYLRPEDGPYFIQFLRELRVALTDVTLSADVLVPQAWSAYYRRDLMALTVDFLCVMAYDEHYPGSEKSGPVASLPFVHQGILDMLKEAPAGQLLLGLPFYNRVWIEQVNNDTPENRQTLHLSMERAKALMNDNGITPVWDPFVGSFYGENATMQDGLAVLYKVWLEDERSIGEKLRVFEENGLAGVAGWRRGFENEETQALLRAATGGQP